MPPPTQLRTAALTKTRDDEQRAGLSATSQAEIGSETQNRSCRSVKTETPGSIEPGVVLTFREVTVNSRADLLAFYRQ
jgi:hypothetical protein